MILHFSDIKKPPASLSASAYLQLEIWTPNSIKPAKSGPTLRREAAVEQSAAWHFDTSDSVQIKQNKIQHDYAALRGGV